MKPLNDYDKNSIMDEAVFKEIFSQQDIVYRSQLIASLSMRAKELRIKGEFDRDVYKRQPSERWTGISTASAFSHPKISPSGIPSVSF